MSSAKCLLVDDKEENLVALAGLLSEEPLEVFTARSGAEALELLLRHDFALALIDVQMPEMDGFELAELMRGTQRTRGIPIIFVTASGPDPVRLFKGYETGAVDFLHKPLCQPIVLSKVRVFVELHQQRETLERQVAALRESQQVIHQALEARDRFVSVAGHELRTPLTVLRLHMDMARRAAARDGQGTTPERMHELLTQLDTQVRRLVPLVDEMLDASRIQSGKLQLQRDRFDLVDLVTDVVTRFTPVLREAGCEITLECPQGAIGDWDHFRLEQVVTNLLSNAVRHGGRGVVHARVACRGGGVELSVSDQGPGVPPEDRERIFHPFEQSTAFDRKGGGLGLGLHIVRQIVEMHDGRIWVESQPGEGACFIVRLPLSQSVAIAQRA